MRYTRYNQNQNNNNNRRRGGRNNFFLIGLVICIPLAIGIGMIFGPMIFKPNSVEGTGDDKKAPVAQENGGNSEGNKEKTNSEEMEKASTVEKENESVDTSTKTGEGEEFFILQCGVYGKEENAKSSLENLPKELSGFVAKDGDKFRVIAGIGNEEDWKKKSETLNGLQIENVRIKTNIPIDDENEIKLAKIIKAYMEILKKFDNSETKSVNTKEFKTWTSELKNEKDGDESEEVKKLKEHVSKLPENFERKDSQNSVEFLYNILNKYRV
ncbi:hypothetical protein [uncultured Clostridium sp.]|uniref:hypothetical protein n=1 Tax=uncultured Clostridium sp. TaxID=59620 RepID=UPI002620A7BB|nr:hypothetical protein [uncultured Clostridium sp.]